MYTVNVTYPIETYETLGTDTIEIRVPVTAYCEGYNNESEEFTNPYMSNIASTTIVVTYDNPVGTAEKVEVIVGKYLTTPGYRYIVSKEKPLILYNGVSEEETEDTYQVRWKTTTGTDGEPTGIVLKETQAEEEQVSDEFIKSDASSESMEEITTNVAIGFSGANSVLKEDGWIKIYDDETDELIVTFTSSDWSKYTSSNPYYYDIPVKHIRVETSATNANATLYVYNIKEIDDEYIIENYEREEFDNLSYIKSTLVGYLDGSYINQDTH